MSNIITVSNVRGYIDENGTAWLNAEDVSRGLGFTRIADSGNEVVRWERVNSYLNDFGFMPTSGHAVKAGDFLPENIFYRLAMKAKNETAEKFQAKVADEILPSIRKTGGYLTAKKVSELFNNPDAIIKICQEWKTALAEADKLRDIVDLQAVEIAELTPKASYYDTVLQSTEALPISVIAKDYGMSGQAMNDTLRRMGIQYKLKSGTWLIYQNYASRGYTCTKTKILENGTTATRTYWTQKGRLFLYERLKQNGILPLIERDDEHGQLLLIKEVEETA